eukprot:TRINITY_DN255_c0_g4_i1.p1 TRINITY_DN255_c0_g4~~TRINITY_DN255_c0_g4_i1.p1  ORF type:complete len:541 (+),score=76.02 TRINITY_DN255_c0_g4_i1:123-1745(+)
MTMLGRVALVSATLATTVGLNCEPTDNSTSNVIACLSCLRNNGKAAEEAYIPQDWSPTEAAEAEAIKHLEEISQRAAPPPGLRVHEIYTDHFKTLALDYHERGDVPRIYLLQGGSWSRSCEFARHSLGYRYSLEHWMHTFLTENPVAVEDDINKADYVYLPHCATGIFMHVVAREMKNDKAQMERTAARRGKRANATSRHQRFLEYEGNLHPNAVRATDDEYLMPLAMGVWAKMPEFKRCLERRGCRFLVVSIYGRHVWRKFSAAFADRAVFVTHAGLSDWLLKQPRSFFLPSSIGANLNDRPHEKIGTSQCEAACPLHCILEPAPVLNDDIVMPWTIAFQWAPRAEEFHSRDILAFYSGTANSCSRDQLESLFRGGFDEALRSDSGGVGHLPPASFGTESPLAAGNRILVFPADHRLLQEEWSELAYRSKLCIAPDGDSPNTGRLIEVIMHGCVPLIISDRLQPPFNEYLDWSKFAFFLREQSLSDLPRLLLRLASPEGLREIEAKQKLLAQAARILDYGSVGIGTTLLLHLRKHRVVS